MFRPYRSSSGCYGPAWQAPLVHAQAGIQSLLDSRFRGNERSLNASLLPERGKTGL
jgi:hypothetical protein